MKCAGHGKVNSKVTRGNNLADACASCDLARQFPPWVNVVCALAEVSEPPSTINALHFKDKLLRLRWNWKCS